MMKLLHIIFSILMTICLLGQGDQLIKKGMYRSYGIEIELKEDTIQYEYVVHIDGGDSLRNFVYSTRSLDTFLIVMSTDLKALPKEKNNFLFFIHGMLGGQRLNLNMTLDNMKDMYLDPLSSDIARMVWIRWPGNTPVYNQAKENGHVIAPSLAIVQSKIVNHLKNVSDTNDLELSIDLLAHSLGCELFKEIYKHEKDNQNRYDQIVLCAADLEVDVFCESGPLEDLHKSCNRASVYHSDKDLTLGISSKLNKRGRLGLDGAHADSHFHSDYVFVNMSQISDETFLPMKLTGHAYYRGSRRAGRDILQTLVGTPADKITGRAFSKKKDNHFKLIPDEEEF